jgi:acyl-CoA thioesterase
MPDTDYSSPEVIEAARKKLFGFFRDFGFFKLLGLELVEVEPYRSRLRVTLRPDLCQPMGIMHGGVIASLVDTAIAQALILTPEYMAAYETGGRIVTVDLRIKYLRPVTEGSIVCEATVPRVGRQITHATAIVTNDAGKEVAYGDSIYMIIHEKQVKRA